MKALLISLAVVLAVVAGAAVIAANNLAATISYILTRGTGLDVSIEKADMGFRQGQAELYLQGLALRGALSGTVRDCRLVVPVGLPIALQEVLISDFTAVIEEGTGGGSFPSVVPVTLLKAEKGLVTYKGRAYAVTEGMVQNLSSRGEFSFSGQISEETLKTRLAVRGKGSYRKKRIEAEGRYDLEGFALATLAAKYLSGAAIANGSFTYRDERFSAQGPLQVEDFRLTAGFLAAPLSINRLEGTLEVLMEGGRGTVTVSGVSFLETAFTVHNHIEGRRFEGLEILSGFFATGELLRRLRLDGVAKRPETLKGSVTGGEVSIKRLAYAPAKPFVLEMDIRDVAFAYGKSMVEAVGGRLTLHGKNLSVADGKARIGNSSFSGVEGATALGGDKGLSFRARYDVDLRDLPALLSEAPRGDLTFLAGTTQGTLSLRQAPGQEPTLSGTGFLNGADLLFREVRLSASGLYRFAGEAITLDPLTVGRAGSEVIVRGTWSKDAKDLALAGTVDVTDGRWPPLSCMGLKGRAGIDLKLVAVPGKARVTGRLDLTGLGVAVPDMLRKEVGTPAELQVDVTRTPELLVFDRLDCTMPSLDVTAQGSFDGSSIPYLSVTVRSDDLRPPARLFLIDSDVEGRLSADLSARDVRLPLTGLPLLDGSIDVENGFARLPGLKQPLEGIHLSARFDGGNATARLTGLRCGKTVVNAGELSVIDPERPRFGLSLDFESIDAADFKGTGETSFPTIEENSLASRAEGNLSITAKHIHAGPLSAADAVFKGSFRRGTLHVESLKGDVMGGAADIKGFLGFAPPSPSITLAGQISDAKSGNFLQALGTKGEIVAGPTTLTGALSTSGSEPPALVSHLTGNLTLESSAGVVGQWHLLSKLLAVLTLNLEELAPDKWSAKAEGLTFRRIGATFTVSQGVFHTDNFVIDSPSMVITGTGDIDAPRRQIDGTVAVSPLTGIDTTIGRIPLLGELLTGDDKGLFYLTYRIKGPLEDPEITKGIGTGLGSQAVDFLKRLFLAPFQRSSP